MGKGSCEWKNLDNVPEQGEHVIVAFKTTGVYARFVFDDLSKVMKVSLGSTLHSLTLLSTWYQPIGSATSTLLFLYRKLHTIGVKSGVSSGHVRTASTTTCPVDRGTG